MNLLKLKHHQLIVETPIHVDSISHTYDVNCLVDMKFSLNFITKVQVYNFKEKGTMGFNVRFLGLGMSYWYDKAGFTYEAAKEAEVKVKKKESKSKKKRLKAQKRGK